MDFLSVSLTIAATKIANFDEQMIGGRDLLKKVRPEGLVFT